MNETPYQRMERSQAEHELVRSLFGRQNDDAALPPAAIVIRLAAELGDTDPIDITQDDG